MHVTDAYAAAIASFPQAEFVNMDPIEVERVKRLATPSRACFVCRREAIADLYFRYAPVCKDCAPVALGGWIMLQFSENEEEAIGAGGGEAGAYLDQIQKTDLATLSEQEWLEFLRHFLCGYSAKMQEGAAKQPPF